MRYILFSLLVFVCLATNAQTSTKTLTTSSTSFDGVGNFGGTYGPVTFSSGDFTSGCLITDVNVSITWAKTDGSCTSPGNGNSFHGETSFRLDGPDGTQVILANAGTWSGNANISKRTTVFDQSAGSIPSGTPTSGTFLPNNGNLNNFNGTSPVGSWNLRPGDNGSGDPLCVESFSVTITAGTVLSSSISSQTNVNCFGASTGSATAAGANGTAPYVYSWSNGGSSATISGLTAGTYTVTVTDANSCPSSTSTVTITQPGSAVSASITTSNDPSCNGGSDGLLTVTPSGGTTPYTFSWVNGATSQSASGLTAGTYTVTVTDQNGCTATSSASLSEPSALSLTGSVVYEETFTGAATYCPGSSQYDNWGIFRANLDPGGTTYNSVVVSGTAGAGATCSDASLVANIATALKNGTTTTVVCAGLTWRIVGGGGSCQTGCANSADDVEFYVHSSVSDCSCNAKTANFRPAIGNANWGGLGTNCGASTQTMRIEFVANSFIGVNSTCNNADDGYIQSVPTGGTTPYTYSWSTGATTSIISGLAPGTYTVTVTDQNGCTATSNATTSEPATLVASTTTNSNITCNGLSDGAATASATGGNSGYLYSWSTGATTAAITGLAAGTYSVTITDAKLCTDSASVTLTQPTAMVASASVTGALDCNGDTDGQVTASASGGTTPYTYSWNTGETNAIETNLGAGTYSVTITDQNGCTDSASVTITQPAALVSSASVTSALDCNGDTDGQVTASATGGTTPYTYNWNTGETNAIETNLGAGTYSVTITDQNGCTDSASVTITQPAALVSSASVASALDCNGDTDGQVTASATGGTTPYTYNWNTGETNAIETNLGAGTYSVTITDQNGCTDSASVTLAQPTALSASAAVTGTLDCNGDTDGQVTASATGGTTPYTYSWNTGETNAIETNLGAGTYSVTITDQNGCTDSASVTLTQPTALSASAAVTGTLDCNGDTDGQVTASATGGTTPYTYNWNTGETNALETGLGAGTYSVTITDQNGCTDSASVTLTQPTALSASAAVTGTLDCNGDTDGQVTASATGGTTPYTYSWNTGGTNALETGLGAGTYSVTITDQNGCTDSASVTITQPAALVSSASVTSALDCNGDTDGQVTASATGGTTPYTYSWNTGGTNALETGLGAGTYSVTITDQNGCTDSASVTLTQPTALSASAAVTGTLDCNGDTDGQVTASATGGTTPYTYNWNTGETNALETGLGAGTYSVTITDQNGCTDSASVTLTQPTALSASAAVTGTLDCNGDTDGQVTASATGGTTPYTYSWNTGGTNALETGLGAGTYSVTITDQNGCTDSASVTITQPAALVSSASVTSALDCNGDTDGQVTASATGGTTPYTYSWNTGGTNALETGLGAGTYSVTITDQNGCTDSASVTITQPAALVSSASVTSALDCNGDTDGQVTASATGGTTPYTYSWNTGGTNALETGLGAGTYSVTITDQNGCTDSASVTITQPAALVASGTVNNNVSCNGLSDGQATASQTGGTSPYTYSWSNGATTAIASGLAVGTYSVTVTDQNGCTDSASITITQPNVLIASGTVDNNASCNGLSDGQATASQTGGTSPFTYAWSNGATTAIASSLAAGTYSVTVTDQNGCTDSASVTITEPAALVASGTVNSNVSCNGLSDGQATASQTGGTSPFTYAWNTGATTAAISSLAAGTYSVTVTDQNGCTDSASVTITQPNTLVASSTGTNISCNGLTDGQASASQTGGTSPYTYAWNTGATTTSISSLAAGTYSVTITDQNGCTDSASVTINEPVALVASGMVNSNVSCNGFNDGQATASQTGGTSPFTYAWSNGATTAIASSLAAGTYSVTVTDQSGCTDSASVTITEPPTLVASAVVDSTVTCNGFADGGATASATGGTGAYTYAWSNSATTASITGVVAGTYSVTITDANGCTDSASVTITEPVALIASTVVDSNITCNGLSDGGATASATGGTGAYTYAWSNSATTASITGVVAGTYSVTITDANGCTDSASVTITEPVALIASTVVDSNITCNGLSDGGATASATGGTGAYTYAWSNSATTASITGVVAGTYSVTVTDANGCTDSASITITQPNVLIASGTVDNNASCNGFADGQATASATGGTIAYTYLWSDGQTSATATGLAAATYSVTITDANGCTDSASVTITEPPTLVASAVVDSTVTCNGFADGGATASAIGGTGAYTYNWSNSATTASIMGVVAGTYSVTITDANGCTDSASVTITEPVALIASTVVDSNITCNGLSDGGATASATGGTGAYTYAWSNSATTASITGVVAGTYSVTITDANGCTDSASITITQPNVLIASGTVDNNASCNGFADGQATASATGGTIAYTYLWSDGQTSATATGLAAATYSVTITDANGCTDSASVTITQPVTLVASTTLDSNVTCNGFANGGATASQTGGTSSYTYLWSNSATTASITGVVAGTYSVTITDANGCTDSASVTITEPPTLVASAVVDSTVTCNGFADGGATASATGGTGAYTYAWSNSATTASITGVVAGTYSVTITDANGCTDSASVTITEPVALIASTVVDSNITCNGLSDGGATASATGGTGAYTYAWSNSATTASITGVVAGTYSVTITDANGCTDSASITITQPNVLIASGTVDNNASCNGFADGQATASATGGTIAYTYLWSDGQTSATATGLAAATYSVTITDANGCTDSASVTITQPVTLVASTTLDSNVTCNGFANGGATASQTGGTSSYTYLWSNSATTASITGVVAGTYSVTITDANGCTDSASVTITEPPTLVASAVVDSTVTCNGFADGGATASAIGGTGAYTYNWSNSATTASITGVVAGTYSVTITDANGCTDSASVTITEPVALIASTVVDSNITCNGLSDGGATASATGGTGAYTYAWSNSATTASITGVVAGTYSVTITDANGCTDSSSVTITQPNVLIASGTVDNNASCNGFADGQATASATGGTIAYTYLWSDGQTSATATGLAAATYSVTITDANGCTDSASVTITQPVTLVASTTLDSNVTCNGFANGGATASQTGGTSSYTYLWSNSATTASITGVVAGTYSVTITDANGCTDSASVTITEPPTLVASAVVDSTVTCNGFADGGATASATGGTGAYTYAWSNSATTASITGVVAGTYSVTITDANGCTDSASVTITEPVALVSSATVDNNASCNGFADGQATASATGGTLTYTFAWSDGQTSATASGLAAGTYSVTITDANGCTDSSSITITQPVTMIASTTLDSNISCNGFSDGGATASATGGTTPYTYAWSNSATTPSITGVVAGTYSVTITDANGCFDSASITITEPVTLVTSSILDSNVSCNGFADGGATASATGGTTPYTYNWSNSATTASITGVVAGTYSVTITDANGCTDSASTTITEPVTLIASSVLDSNVTCNGFADGGATASATGGTTPYTYNWSNSATTAFITGVVAGTYSVTITDANGCTDSASTTITEPVLLVSSATVDNNASCSGFADGQATASATGGTLTYTFAWSDGQTSATASGLAAGTYSVTITDANGCTDSSSITITQPVTMIASTTLDSNISCNGFSDGGATASATGGTTPYTYAWSNSATTPSITGVVAGTYSVTITDANGCFDSASITITEPVTLVTSSILDSNVSCNGFADGGATASATGGTTPYTYNWSNSATTASITGVVAGTYSVTITDANGCTDSASTTITEPLVLIASSVVDSNVSCNAGSDGGASSSATGGTMPYTYNWSNGATTASITGVMAGTYSVTITDANGCTDSASSIITEPAPLIASTVLDSNVTCNGFSNGGATSSATGGTGAYTYNWSNSATTASITGVAAGTYSVTITDANGCTDSASVIVSEAALIVLSSTVDSNVTCNGFANGGATASISGGTSPYTYAWSNGATTASITGVVAGTYTVTITDQNGCNDTISATITEPAVLIASSVLDSNVTCNGFADGGATASATGGTTPYTYNWSNSATTASITGVTAGTYSVTITDANGCTDSASTTITEPVTLVASTSLDNNVSCNAGSDGAATASATGGTLPYTYSWSTGATTASVTGLSAGTYSVTITDANACTDDASITITEPLLLTASTSLDNNVSCNGFSDGGATASATGGTIPYTYSWSNGVTTASISGVVAGTYSVTITDQNGCTDSASITITEPVTLIASTALDNNVSCNGFADGGATASATGGTTPYTYSWSNGTTTASITGVVAGTYSVTITDANSCTDSASITITEPPTLVASSVLDSNVNCNGFADGGATASATGGTTPYTYNWSNSATTASITGVTAGTYSVTITDANGCTDSASTTITEPVTLVASTSLDNNVSCNAGSDGAATASATGGTLPYTYSWSTGATTASVTGLSAGTYSVTITDANACTDDASITITEPLLLTASTLADNNVSCNGLSDGSATATGAGGTTPYTYDWSTGGTTATITGLAAGSYTVSITDANGCGPAISTVTITEPAILVASSLVDNHVSCNGLANGQATASATGGTTAYTYAWSDGQTTATASGLLAGTYSVTVTDANGCTDSTSITITEPPTLVASSVLDSNVTCNGFADGGATASATGGTTPYTYNWSNSATTASITGVVAGTYSVTITDANGCTDSASTTITEPTALLSSVTIDSTITCNGLSNGGATVSVSGGVTPYTYSWSNGITNDFITGVAAGTYTVTITDQNGCVLIDSAIITEPLVLVAQIDSSSNVTCNGSADGWASASATGGTAPYTYSWPSGTTMASDSNLTQGSYIITITDQNGCTSTDTVEILEPAVLIASISGQTPVSCNGGNDGTATVNVTGGNVPYTYLWPSGGTDSLETGLSAGTYIVTVTDTLGCLDTSSVTITEPTLLTTTISSFTDVSCNGFSDGQATVSGTGGLVPYTYIWSSGGTDSTETGLVAGTHFVTVSDINNCTTVDSVVISQPDSLLSSVTVNTHVSCFDLSDGEIEVVATGGTAQYTYDWSSGGSSSIEGSLAAGTYTITVTDAQSCTIVSSIEVTEPDLLEVDFTDVTNPSFFGHEDGSITASPFGGTNPYLYDWSSGGTSMIEGELGIGTYTVTITDDNNCTVTNQVTLTQPEILLEIGILVTPNGDGDNDTWVIDGLHIYPNAKIMVINQWGNEVFKSTGYNTPWDGKFNGNDLPIGSYFYTIDLNDANVPAGKSLYTGSITLIR